VWNRSLVCLIGTTLGGNPMTVATRLGSVVRSGTGIALVAALCVTPILAGQPSGDVPQPFRLHPVAKPATSFTPHTGATFNRPTGSPAEQRRIFQKVNKTIDAVPRGGFIRVAVFSFSEKKTADALLRARARGVRVRIIFDDHKVYPQESRLRRAFGKNTKARSFVLYCHHACRGRAGDMHNKMFLFSSAGHARNISMIGSNNMTEHNAVDQWSDVYTIANNRSMFVTYRNLFSRLKAGWAHKRAANSSTFYRVRHGRYRASFFPNPGVSRQRDPLMRTLDGVSCNGARQGTGVKGHTLVRISMHAWYGPRGLALANKVASLRKQGCRVAVIPGETMGTKIRATLRDAKVKFPKIRHPKKRVHQKVLTISGRFASDTSAQLVFTGSHNWSSRGLDCDDNILRIDSRTAYRQYASNFRYIWHHG
jgi:phosphatidylserine/phosphatidylglycerophosphate/cardiolipin synthase-like enzyme